MGAYCALVIAAGVTPAAPSQADNTITPDQPYFILLDQARAGGTGKSVTIAMAWRRQQQNSRRRVNC